MPGIRLDAEEVLYRLGLRNPNYIYIEKPERRNMFYKFFQKIVLTIIKDALEKGYSQKIIGVSGRIGVNIDNGIIHADEFVSEKSYLKENTDLEKIETKLNNLYEYLELNYITHPIIKRKKNNA